MTNPIAQAQGDPVRPLRTGPGSRLDREGNEVADFFDQRAERVARDDSGGGAKLLSARQRAIAAIQERAYIYDRRVGHCRGNGGDGDGARRIARGGAEQRVERCRTDPCVNQPLVGGPRPDEVR